MDIIKKIKEQISENDILLYMKGSPYEPQCGFSAKTVQALIECEAEFSYVDILSNPENYLWSHRRFKNRPEGEAPFYPEDLLRKRI